MSKRDKLRQEMKKQGLTDPRLEKGKRVNLFALLRSFGVDNPKQTLTRFVHDEIKTSKEVQTITQSSTGSLSLGPWSSSGILGFVNRTGSSLTLSDEKVRGTGTIQWRRLEGITKTLPITVPNGQVFEINVTNIGAANFANGDSRFYVAYKATKA